MFCCIMNCNNSKSTQITQFENHKYSTVKSVKSHVHVVTNLKLKIIKYKVPKNE